MYDNNMGISFLKKWETEAPLNIDTQFVIAKGDNDELITLARSSGLTYIRPNIGRDYGSYQWSWATHRYAGFTHFLFLNDDIVFATPDWFDKMHAGFALDENIGIVSAQVGLNHKGQRIPRGPFWSAKAEVMDALDWQPLTCTQDAYDQEMDLIPPLYDRWKIAQVGNCTNILYDGWKRGPEYVDKDTVF